MLYDNRLTNLKKAWLDGGVSRGAASIHVFRRAATHYSFAWQQTSPLRILAASCVSRTELIHASEQWHGRRLSGYISP